MSDKPRTYGASSVLPDDADEWLTDVIKQDTVEAVRRYAKLDGLTIVSEVTVRIDHAVMPWYVQDRETGADVKLPDRQVRAFCLVEETQQ